MPAKTFLLHEIKSRLETLKEDLKDLAVRKGIVARREEAIVRNILPKTDLGFTNEAWRISLTTANAYNTVIDMTVPDKKIIVFYGVKVVENYKVPFTKPLTTLIRFRTPAKTKDIVNIEGIELVENGEKLFDAVIKFENNEHMIVDFYARGTGTDKLMLLGYVVEPVGEIISPE